VDKLKKRQDMTKLFVRYSAPSRTVTRR